MFHKLHRQMTLFCTGITGLILVFLTTLCLFITEDELQSNNYVSFLNSTTSILTHLQSDEAISLQWINQLREKNGFTIFLYDNGTPLFSHILTTPEQDLPSGLLEATITTAKEDYSIDISTENHNLLPLHAEFTMEFPNMEPYYVCAGAIPKEAGSLSFLLFYSTDVHQNALLRQRLAFAAADAFGLVLLFLFSWFFTGKMLTPLEENNRRQMQFVASASHELRTPLAVILSGLETMDKTSNSKEREHFSTILKQECVRMQHLVSSMLLLSNFDAKSFQIHMKPCQPDELLLQAYEKYELLAKQKNLSLQIVLPNVEAGNQVPDCLCDPEYMLQVLSILLDNALSYTPEYGTITISLLIPQKQSPSSTGTVTFQVADTGPGIPASAHKLIFQRFYRSEHSHTNREHFGLGLCLAKEIVDAHHGTITVSDTPVTGGACFAVTLKTV